MDGTQGGSCAEQGGWRGERGGVRGVRGGGGGTRGGDNRLSVHVRAQQQLTLSLFLTNWFSWLLDGNSTYGPSVYPLFPSNHCFPSSYPASPQSLLSLFLHIETGHSLPPATLFKIVQ
jgi:hypothetical protein